MTNMKNIITHFNNKQDIDMTFNKFRSLSSDERRSLIRDIKITKVLK